MQDHFTIKIHCKKYVKAYLESNCGSPVDLRHLPDLLQDLRYCLAKKPGRREKAKVAEWSDTVTIIIPTYYFYRYGWEFNKENELNFNRTVERRVKFLMRQYVALNHTLSLPVSACIREFQERFGFYEPIWGFESIKKDFVRNGHTIDLQKIRLLRTEMNKIFLTNLSDLGTISKKFKNEMSNG